MSHMVKTVVALTFFASTAWAETFTVNTSSDDVDANLSDNTCETVAGGGDCSLRAAVQQANATTGTDEIVIPAGIFSLITPGEEENAAATGDLDITESVTIRGAGADKTFINGGRLDRVFDVNPARTAGVTVEMRALTVQDGSSGLGGGIQNAAALTLNGVAISDNTATADGGGIFSRSAVTLVDSLISGNESASDGAGILCGGTLTLTNCTVSGNTAGGSAGGIDNRGPLMMRFSTISGNGAASGAGGLLSRTSVANTSVGSTIVAGNTPVNCSQVVTTAGNNIEATSTCGFSAGSDQRNTDPELCPLDNYGGSTHTHALPGTSVARDTGATANCPATDQRGLPRPQDGDGTGGAVCDVGAFEAQAVGGGCEPVTPTATAPLGTPTPTAQSPTATAATPTATPPVGTGCPGDCDGSDNVSVDELVRGVNIALNRANVSTCPAMDRDNSGTVAVNELVTAVNSALRGCP
jgi:CSLREA domain-containing protein